MTLRIEDLSVWIPRRGTVLSRLSAESTGVTAIVGRSGSGATTLLRTVGGRLPAGSRISGAIRLDGATLSRLTGAELAGTVDATHLADLPDLPIPKLLAGVDPALVAEFGLDGATYPLPPHLRAAAKLLRAVAAPAAPVVLLDQPLLGLDPALRASACRAIGSLGASGSIVLWAEHLVEEALATADRIVELLGPAGAESSTPGSWTPRTIPAPPAMALARAVGMARSVWSDPGLDELAATAQGRGGLTPRRRRRRETGDALATAQPPQTRLDREIELRAGECVGIVSVAPNRAREIDLARRLGAVAGGENTLAPTLAVPAAVPVGRVVAAWEKAHGVPRGAVATHVEPLARLDPERPLISHSAGEGAALCWGLAQTLATPRVLIEPTRGIDPAGRRHVARSLFDDPGVASFLVSGDVEVLARACHRVVLIDGHAVIADGTPLAVGELMPHAPQLARLGLRALRVADIAPVSELREADR